MEQDVPKLGAIFAKLMGDVLDFRAYLLGPDGHVQNCVELRCGDEAEARSLARQLVSDRDVELWLLDRMIETFKAPSSVTRDRAC
jgi:hypothetical protein